MKKFKVTVTRTVEYEVTVDERLWNAQEQESWERTFWDLPYGYNDPSGDPDAESAAAFAQGLAEQSARLGANQFIEGFGMCATSKDYADSWNAMEHPKGTTLCTEGLYIEQQDDEVYSDIEDITEEED